MKSNKNYTAIIKFLISLAVFLFVSCDIGISMLSVNYTVVHYKENVYDSDYTVEETETLTGIPSMMTAAKSKEYEGFTVQNDWKQEKILSDGSTSVKLYYTRNEYQLTFYCEGEKYSSKYYKYESSITKPQDPTRTGYKFIGWDKEIPSVMPAYDVEINAKWEKIETPPTDPVDPVDPEDPEDPVNPPENPTKTAEYKVVHYKENINDSNYFIDETITLSGLIGEQTSATSKSYEGFTEKKGWNQTSILSDGSTVVSIYYTRNEYKITFYSEGEEYVSQKYKYESPVESPAEPTRTDYTFAGWDKTIPSTMPAQNIVINAIWEENNSEASVPIESENSENVSKETSTTAVYKVYHFKQDMEKESLYNIAEEECLTGNIGEVPVVTERKYEGYYVFSNNSKKTTIQADGSTVVSIYYVRRTYDFLFGSDSELILQLKLKEGEKVTPPEDPVKEGYDFIGWDIAIPEYMPAKRMKANAMWKKIGEPDDIPAEDDTPKYAKYKIIHKGESDNLGYEILETEVKTGLVGEKLSDKEIKDFDGYIFYLFHEVYKTILADGSLEVSIYYRKVRYSLTYNVDGEAYSVRHLLPEAKTYVPQEPVKEGYVFRGWDISIPETMPKENLTANAKWEKINPGYAVYEVKHSLPYPKNPIIEKMIGKVGTLTQARVMITPDYWVSPDQDWNQQIIKEDGSTVVTINYDTSSYYITYDVDGGYIFSYTWNQPYPIDYTIKPADPKKTGYTYVGIDTPYTKMPNHDIEVKLIWEKNESETTDAEPEERQLVKYRVIHGYEKLDLKTAYDFDFDEEIEIKTGYIGDFTEAVPKIREGFYIDFDYYGYGQSLLSYEKLTTVKIRYGRRNSMLTFDTAGGSSIKSLYQKYEAPIPEIENPTREGYTFVRWEPAIPSLTPAHNTVFTAIWEEETTDKNPTGSFEGVIY